MVEPINSYYMVLMLNIWQVTEGEGEERWLIDLHGFAAGKNPMIGFLDPSEAILDYVSYENTLDSNALHALWFITSEVK